MDPTRYSSTIISSNSPNGRTSFSLFIMRLFPSIIYHKLQSNCGNPLCHTSFGHLRPFLCILSYFLKLRANSRLLSFNLHHPRNLSALTQELFTIILNMNFKSIADSFSTDSPSLILNAVTGIPPSSFLSCLIQEFYYYLPRGLQ